MELINLVVHVSVVKLHQLINNAASDWASQGVFVKIAQKEDLNDLDSCWRNRFVGYNGKYYLYMDNALMTRLFYIFMVNVSRFRDVVMKIRNSTCVRGLMLYLDQSSTVSTTSRHSADASCPNAYAGS